jgi:hypothetical protein
VYYCIVLLSTKHDPGACVICLNADAWAQTYDLRLLAYIISVLCTRLLFRKDYEEKVFVILKI